MQALDYTPYFARIGADPLRDAFATRRAVMPWRGGRAVAADEMSAQWNRLLGDATCNESTIDSDRGRVVYLHVPFTPRMSFSNSMAVFPQARSGTGFTTSRVAVP
jgi:oxygen-independent coproporphyrinogen-3 oxidase